jgi:hypothetical protein
VGPLGVLGNYLQNLVNRRVDLSGAKISLLSGPKHGKLETVEHGEFSGVTNYVPNNRYYGLDRVTYRVTLGDKSVRVVDTIHVVEGVVSDYEISTLCPKDVWKIASAMDSAGGERGQSLSGPGLMTVYAAR